MKKERKKYRIFDREKKEKKIEGRTFEVDPQGVTTTETSSTGDREARSLEGTRITKRPFVVEIADGDPSAGKEGSSGMTKRKTNQK